MKIVIKENSNSKFFNIKCIFIIALLIFGYKINAYCYENKLFYIGCNIGTGGAMGIDSPEGTSYEAFLFGLNSGFIINNKTLVGIDINFLGLWQDTGASTDEVEDYSTSYKFHEYYLILTFFPYQEKSNLPDGFLIKGGIGYVIFRYKSNNPDYHSRYNIDDEEKTRNRGIAYILGLGYSFTLSGKDNRICCLGTGNFSINFDFAYHRYYKPIEICDVYVLTGYASMKLFL